MRSASRSSRILGASPSSPLVLLRGYKRAISPNLPKNCRFVPTCSEYTALAIKEFGFARGLCCSSGG